MRFDWYEATVDAGHDEVIGELLTLTGGQGELRPFRGMTHGYERAYEVRHGDDTRAVVMWAGQSMGNGVHVRSSGQDAPAVAQVCRKHWSHAVTRMDVAEDFDAPGAFDRLISVGMEVCKDHGLKTRNAGDWAQAQDGRTLTWGSRTSVAQARAYEKGYEQRAKGREDASLDWARLEMQLRPKKVARVMLAQMEPAQCWGITAWTQDLLQRVTGLEVPRFQDAVWRANDDERAWKWMLKQYGPLLARKREQHGSWAQVGVLIGAGLPRSTDEGEQRWTRDEGSD